MKMQVILYLLALPLLLIIGDLGHKWPRRWPLVSLAGLVIIFLGFISLLPQIHAWPLIYWPHAEHPWAFGLSLEGAGVLLLFTFLGIALVLANFWLGLGQGSIEMVRPVMIFIILTAILVSADNIYSFFTAIMLATAIHYGQVVGVIVERGDRLLAKSFFLLDYLANGLIFFGLLAVAYLLPGTSFKFFTPEAVPAFPAAVSFALMAAVFIKFFGYTLLGHLAFTLKQHLLFKQFFIWAFGAAELIFLFYKTQHIFLPPALLPLMAKILLGMALFFLGQALRAVRPSLIIGLMFLGLTALDLVFGLFDFWPLMFFFSVNLILIFLFIFFIAALSLRRSNGQEGLAVLAGPIQDWPFLYLLFLLLLLNLALFPGTPGHLGISALLQHTSAQTLLQILLWPVLILAQLGAAKWMFIILLNPLFSKQVILRRQRPMTLSLLISLVALFLAALSANLWFIIPCPWNTSLKFGAYLFGSAVTYLPARMAFSMGHLFIYFGTLSAALFFAYLYYFPFGQSGWRSNGQQFLRRYLKPAAKDSWIILIPAYLGHQLLGVGQKLDLVFAASEDLLGKIMLWGKDRLLAISHIGRLNRLTVDLVMMILIFILAVGICLGPGRAL